MATAHLRYSGEAQLMVTHPYGENIAQAESRCSDKRVVNRGSMSPAGVKVKYGVRPWEDGWMDRMIYPSIHLLCLSTSAGHVEWTPTQKESWVPLPKGGHFMFFIQQEKEQKWMSFLIVYCAFMFPVPLHRFGVRGVWYDGDTKQWIGSGLPQY